jgi:hypothetical protein
MTLLSVVKDVCAEVGVTVPASIFAGIGGNRTMQEMVSKANEMAQRIAYDNREWRRLKAVATHTGDGIATAFALPANFKRMLLNSNVWLSTSTMAPARFIADADDWVHRRARDYSEVNCEWALIGSQIQIWPALEAGVTATYAYLNKNCIALSGGGYGDIFQNDADSFALDERLLKLAMIWQWKASKGSPYAEDMSTYGDALAMAQGADTPAPTIIGRKHVSAAVIAYPWIVP